MHPTHHEESEADTRRETIVMPAADDSARLRDDVVTMYTCPMHPQIGRPDPGNCPICGMALAFAPGVGVMHRASWTILIESTGFRFTGLATE